MLRCFRETSSRKLLLASGVSFMLFAGEARADWLVMTGGQRAEVRAFSLRERSVDVITLSDKSWSILRDAVDVPATLAANGMSSEERDSPSWPSPRGSRPSTPETVRESSPPPPLPPPPAPSPSGSSGPSPVEVQEPEPRAPRTAPRRPSEPRYRLALFANGSAMTRPLEFAESRQFLLFEEQARVDTRYRDPMRPGVELGGLVRIAGPLGVSASVELFQHDRDAAFDAFLPHPFLFDRAREISGSRSNLSHREHAVHVDGVITGRWGDVVLDVFGGPSLFLTRTELLTDVRYSEVFPFDQVIPLGTEEQVFEDRPLGFNLGAHATYRLAGPFGATLGARFSRARVRITPGEGRTVEFDAGGLRVAAGLRLLFP